MKYSELDRDPNATLTSKISKGVDLNDWFKKNMPKTWLDRIASYKLQDIRTDKPARKEDT